MKGLLRISLIALPLLLLALGLNARHRAPQEHSETFYVLGTLVEIVVRGEDPATAARATAEAGHLLQRLHRDWHAWNPGPLGDLNAALAKGRTAEINAELAEILTLGRTLSCESAGHFNPAIGALVALWGFHADVPVAGPIPQRSAVEAMRRAGPEMSDLWIAGTQVSSRNTAVQLDLGGYGKGAALDRAAALLHAHGVRDAVLNAGGDVNVLGRHGARPWRVAIRDPFVWGVIGGIDMRAGEVLYTSGNYERFIERGSERFAHIIDPATGYPVEDLISVTVLHTDGARADAAATALSVAGQAGWAQVAANMGVEAALLVTGDGALLATDAMADRLNLVEGGTWGPIQRIPLPPAQDLHHCR